MGFEISSSFLLHSSLTAIIFCLLLLWKVYRWYLSTDSESDELSPEVSLVRRKLLHYIIFLTWGIIFSVNIGNLGVFISFVTALRRLPLWSLGCNIFPGILVYLVFRSKAPANKEPGIAAAETAMAV